MYVLDEKSKTPLYIQLFEALKEDICQHKKVGSKIDSIRKVASLYNLSKTTVEAAFSQLVVEGYIQSLPKSGYVVCSNIQTPFTKVYPSQKQTKEQARFDFYPARLSKELFPLKLWKRLYIKTLTKELDFGSYPEGQGEFGLRVQLALYLSSSRRVLCEPSQIIISNGFSDSMGILASMFENTHTHFATENPGYYIARELFANRGYEVEKVPLDAQGLDVRALAKVNAKLLYITPSHQYPTGVSMPLKRRQELLSWAHEKKAYIIEDDYDSELSFSNRPIPSLQGLDSSGKVIYLGTFSKAFSAAIRLSYMVLPKELLATYKQHFDVSFARVGLDTQKTMELFLKEGHWEKHLRKVRTANKKKHNLMKELLKKYFGSSMKIVSEGAGLCINVQATRAFDKELFLKSCEEEGIKVYFAKERCGGDWDALRMGFGGFETQEQMSEGVKTLAVLWRQALHT